MTTNYLICFILMFTAPLFSSHKNEIAESIDQCILTLDKYRQFLVDGTYEGADWTGFIKIPLSRYETFKIAFVHFIENNGTVIVELGTSRSFVHGGLIGCNQDDPQFWTPYEPQNWDWGAGFFTRVVSECLNHTNPKIHTVDIVVSHINRCRLITEPYKKNIKYHVSSSVDFLKNMPPKSIDLLYLDTGDMWPIEPTAQLQLEEAVIIVENNLISDKGIILIDDVKNQTPKKFGEESNLGKSKYSIPYLLKNGYEIIADEYQVILMKK